MSSASGHLSSDISYHIVLQGHYAYYTFTPDSETYSETGSTSEDHAAANTAGYMGMGGSNSSDGTSSSNWSLSWSGTFTGGMVSVTSFVGTSSNQWHAHSHTADSMGGFWDSVADNGSTTTQSGSGTQALSSGSSWQHNHYQSHYSGGMPDYVYDSSSNFPYSGTGMLYVSPLYAPLQWKAEVQNATNFSFHGLSTLTGTLAETATWTSGNLAVNSFNSTTQDHDLGHVIEDEPATVMTGTENYHKDQLFTGGLDVTGSGAYTSASTSADYHVTEFGSMVAHNVLTVVGDQSTGMDDSGLPYTMTFNYTGDRTTTGSYSNVFDYHDAADGMRVVDSTFSGTDGTTAIYTSSGVRNAVPFSDSSTQTESGGGTGSFPPTGLPTQPPDNLLQAYPYTVADSSHFLVAYGGPGQMAPPAGGGMLMGGGGIGKLPQGYYNQRIQQIGEDAKKKVAGLAAQKIVINQMNIPLIRPATGTVTIAEGLTWAQAVGQGAELDKALKDAKKTAERLMYTGVTITQQVDFTWAVQPRPAPGKDRSGKCVVEYKIRVNITGTNTVGRGTTLPSGLLVGSMWFVDGNLKTATLQGDQ